MSSFDLPQKVTYWTGKADGNGTITWNAGIAVDARFMRKDGVVRTIKGDDQITTHIIYSETLIPKRALVVLEDQDKVAVPPDGAREILDNIDNSSAIDLFWHAL